MPASAKYRDLYTAAYYGDMKLLKKLVEAEVEGEEDAGEEKDEAAVERIEALHEQRVNCSGLLTTYANQVRHKQWGFGFHLERDEEVMDVNAANCFQHVYKCSGKSDTTATPLHWAVLGGELEAAQYLLRKGAKTDVTVTPFHATPMDVARVNASEALLDVMVGEEAQVLQKIESGKVELQEMYDALAEQPRAEGVVKAIADVTLPSVYYNNSFMKAALEGSRAEAVRETGAPNYIAMGVDPVGGDVPDAPAPAPAKDVDPSRRALKEVLSKLPVSVAKLAVLGDRLAAIQEAAGGFGGPRALTATELLCTVLTSCGAADAKVLLEADPEGDAEYPDVFVETLAHQPPPPPEEGDGDEPKPPPPAVDPPYAGVDQVLAGVCYAMDPRKAYLFLKEPEEKFGEALKAMQPDADDAPKRALLRHLTVSGSEEETMKAVGEGGAGVLVVFDGVAFGCDLSKLSRYPADAPLLLPAGTQLRVVNVEAPPAEPPAEPEEGEAPPEGPPPVTVLTITMACAAPDAPPTAVTSDGDDTLRDVLALLAQKQQLRAWKQEAEDIRNPPPPPKAEGDGGEEGEEREEGDGDGGDDE